MVQQRSVQIRANALEDALHDFGWETPDIVDALMRLRPKHFYKSDESKKKPGTLLDIYKACGLKGEDVYMHFYIDDVKGVLVVNSFKRL